MKSNHQKLFYSLIFFYLLQCTQPANGQIGIDVKQIKYSVTEYIFLGQPTLWPCNSKGFSIEEVTEKNSTPSKPVESKTFSLRENFVFTVEDTFRDINSKQLYYVIIFNKFKTKKRLFESTAKYRSRLNLAYYYNLSGLHAKGRTDTSLFTHSLFKDSSDRSLKKMIDIGFDDPELRGYFALSESDLERFAYLYSPKISSEFTVGTVTELIRYRPRVDSVRSIWGSDINFGVSAGRKYTINKTTSITWLLGLAISKVTLDSISTRGFLGASDEKASLTPSINLLYTVNNFSFGLGIGMDIVNRDSQEVKQWVYNHRLFYGIAFGINIFSNNNTSNSTPSSNGQTTSN